MPTLTSSYKLGEYSSMAFNPHYQNHSNIGHCNYNQWLSVPKLFYTFNDPNLKKNEGNINLCITITIIFIWINWIHNKEQNNNGI